MNKQEREEQRSAAFFEVVHPIFADYFKGKYRVVEFCAGNGNGGRQFIEKGNVSWVHFVDVQKVRGLEETLRRVKDQAVVHLGGIEEYRFLPQNIASIAIHACGDLTDLVLTKSVEASVPVAVMPCCYSSEPMYDLKDKPDPRLMLYEGKEDFQDEIRMQFLREQGYGVQKYHIDQKITRMNTILVGVPKKIQ